MHKNIRDSYKLYCEDEKDPIDKKKYVKINNAFNKFMIEKVLEGNTILLPSRVGPLYIRGRKQKVKIDEDGNILGLAPNWKETKKLWERDPEAAKEKKIIYHTNAHTEGIIYSYCWSKKNLLVPNKIMYSLIMTRANKRALAKQIKKFNKTYKVL